MMDLATIRAMSAEQAALAAAANLTPYTVEQEDIDDWKSGARRMRFPFPNIGDYRPEGWELIDTLFVDKSGFGSPGEPALTVEQLLDRLVAGNGYAIIEEGQFQLYLGEFVKN